MRGKPMLIILGNENSSDTLLWEKACAEYTDLVEYKVVNLTGSDWLKDIQEIKKVDYLLTKPGGHTSLFKQLYDERLTILVKELKYLAFPTLDEILIYENKRYFSYWLKAYNLPHPETLISYDKNEAMDFVRNTRYPIVAKLNIGASGNGIEILRGINEGVKYVTEIFTKGKTSRTGPKVNKGKIIKRFLRKTTHPKELIERIKVYRAIASDYQKGFVFLQEYIPHQYEWRVVRIGDSFFAHKKLLKKDKASGSLIKGYVNPPKKLLDFVKEITDHFGFYSQAVDIFEPEEGDYLINEMQCIFGQSDSYQMMVDGKPGRYIKKGEKWIFEEGLFNQNESYNLRLEFVLDQLKKKI